MSRKPRRVKPQSEKIKYIVTTFFTAPNTEESLSVDCFNVLNALSLSRAYPELNAKAEDGKLIWAEYDDLVKKSKTIENSSKITDAKAAARFRLTYMIQSLIWAVLLEGKNDALKMTGDTGLEIMGTRRTAQPITTAPAKIKFGVAIPDAANADTFSLPIVFGRLGTPKSVRGSSYRLRLENSTDWSQPINFANNRKRSIPSLTLGTKGHLQVRYNGGALGNGPWSEEVMFVVAGQVI